MTLYDISIPLSSDTPPWPGDTPFTCGWPSLISEGASVNVSAIATSPHVGTHADAPLHVQDGWLAAESLPLDAFHGHASVVHLPDSVSEVSLAALNRLLPSLAAGGETSLPRVTRLLLRTGRSIAGGVFPDDWPVLEPSCIAALLGQGLLLVGTDAPSVDPRPSRNLERHRALFAGGAAVLENLDLRDVPPGDYELFAFPLKVHGTDAAPVRAVLRAG